MNEEVEKTEEHVAQSRLGVQKLEVSRDEHDLANLMNIGFDFFEGAPWLGVSYNQGLADAVHFLLGQHEIETIRNFRM